LHDIKARRAARGDDKPVNGRKERRPYTQTDVADLIQLHEVEGLTFRQIDVKQQRCFGSSIAKYESLRRGPDPRHMSEAGDHVRLTPEQQAIRNTLKHAQSRQSDISRLLGEPPPGFSALDQKRAAGESPR
jgi:hypothetical protein